MPLLLKVFKAISKGTKAIASGTKKSFGWAKGQAGNLRKGIAARRDAAAQRRAENQVAREQSAPAATEQGENEMARAPRLPKLERKKNAWENRSGIWAARNSIAGARTSVATEKTRAASARKTFGSNVKVATVNARTALVQARDTNMAARESSRILRQQIKDSGFNRKVGIGTERLRQRGLNQSVTVQKLQDRLDKLRYEIDRPRGGPFANMVKGRLQRQYNKTLIALQRMQGRSAKTGRRYVRQDSRRRNPAGQQMQVAEAGEAEEQEEVEDRAA